MGPTFSGCHLEEEWDEVDGEQFSTFKSKLLSFLPQEGEEIQNISIRPMGWGEHMEIGKGVVGPERLPSESEKAARSTEAVSSGRPASRPKHRANPKPCAPDEALT